MILRLLSTVAALLLYLGAGGIAEAIDPPHDSTNGYSCGNCHSVHMTLGSTGYSNACLNCHRPGVPLAERKPFTLADMANPFGTFTASIGGARYQTSHSWTGPHLNVPAGADEPLNPDLAGTSTVAGLGCARCHDMHTYKDAPFLRALNDQDQMCLDCHRSRNAQDHMSGTHPVNFNYTGAQSLVRSKPDQFNNPPLNANPANPTAAMRLKNGTVLCSTCHGVHYTDSNSSTFDSFSSYYNLKPSTGALLRTDLKGATGDSINICTNCHVRKNHNVRGQNIQCVDCHGGHVDIGDGQAPNVFLVRRTVDAPTETGTVSKTIFMLVTSASERPYKSADGTGVCQACHQVPEGPGYPSVHRLPAASANACSICHPHNAPRGAFTAAGGSCAACHGHVETSAAPMATGKHTAHINSALNPAIGTPFGCQECHAKTVSDSDTIISSVYHANGVLSDYSGVKARGSANYNSATGVCSNLYCHSDGKGKTKDMASSGWKSAATLDCAGCHGSDPMPAFATRAGEPNYASTGAGTSGANSHYKHTKSGADSCEACHTSTTTTGVAIAAGSTLHVNRNIDVTFNATKAGTGITWASGTKTCTNISCHFGGTAQWGAILDCAACHGGDATTAAPMATGKHQAHVNNAALLGTNFTCADCHAKTVSGNSTIINGTMHANSMADYSGVRAGGSASYNPTTKTCSTFYCHSDGKGTGKDMSAATWTSAATLDCAGCHGSDAAPSFASQAGEPNYTNAGAGALRANSHEKHAKAGAGSCDACHTLTTSNGTAIKSGSTKHIDSAIDVTFNTTKAGAGVAWNAGTKTCSNISCHFGGNAQWGGTLSCTACHGGSVASGVPMTSGKHQAHVNNAAVIGTNFACVECHARTIDGTGSIINPQNHANTFADYSGPRAGGSANYNPSTKVCSNFYCHSDGKGMAQSMAASGWSSAVTMGCKGCHGNDPTPAFTSMAGEPNYPNAGTGQPRANSHRKHTLAGAASCDTCHTSTTTNGTVIALGSPLHLNSVIDVTFNGAKAGAGAGWTASSKTCNNVSCHGGNSVTWGSVLNCQDCHGGVNDVNDFNGSFWNNGSASIVRMSGGWNASGHGRPAASGTYPSGNPAADFFVATNGCEYCHDTNVEHKTVANLFRLRNYSTLQWGRNAVCQACHGAGSTGIALSGVLRNGSRKVDSRHFGDKHGDPNSGGQFCWDCHDPHGDDNSFMVHDQVAKESDSVTGAPRVTAATTFVLTSPPSLMWEDFVKTPANDGVCQVCHNAATIQHFNATTYDAGHNPGGSCIACHPHNGQTQAQAFGPNGNCDTCHGYPPIRRGLALGTFRVTGNYSSARYQDYSGGGGAHSIEAHVKASARASEGWANCAVCHSNGSMAPSSHIMQMPIRPSTITVDVADEFKFDYMRGLEADRYTGKLTDNHDNETGSCSNVNCHFKKAKRWSTEK